MKRALSVALLVGMAVAGVGLATSPLVAQGPAAIQSTKVGVVVPSTVIKEMQEAKDLQAKINNERDIAFKKVEDLKLKINELREQLKMLKEDSPNYADKVREITEASINAEARTKLMQVDLDRTNRVQLRMLFEKIATTTAKVAKQKGYDVVLADNHQALDGPLDGVTRDQLTAAIATRQLMYFRPDLDITSDVIASLDAEYKK